MPRRSERQSQKMSDSEKDVAESVDSCSEDEKTIIEQPSTQELREEILQLKESVKILMEKCRDTTLSTQQQQPPKVSHDLPNTTDALSAVGNGHVNIPPFMQVSTPPMQHTCLSEYKNHYPTFLLPNTAAQQVVQTTVPLHFATPQSTPFVQPPSTPFVQPQQSQTFSNTMPRVSTAVSSAYMPPFSQNATMSVPTPQVRERQMYRELRKLHELPEFSGQPEQWPMFNVAFNETTRNYGYTNLENLMRLQKAIKGDAKRIVETFLIHPENVDQVMRTLEFHYGRPQVLIRSQIAKVRLIPQIPAKKMYELVNFSTMVSNLTVFLENAGATPHLSNPTLMDELVNKLPPSKKEEWMKYSMQNLDQYPTIRQFSIWLQEVATYIALAAEVEKTDLHGHRKDKMNPTFTITTNKQNKCLHCQQSHGLYNCEKFKQLSTADRWRFVKNNNLCFCCLSTGHSLLRCQRKRQCGLSRCTRYHNRLLHEHHQDQKNVNSEKTNENFSRMVVRDDNKTINKEKAESAVHAIVNDPLNEKTLFKFLPVKLTGPKGSVVVVAFIDEGSKISLVEEEIATQIGLKGSSRKLCLGWIGGKTTNEISRKVDFEISGFDNDRYFNIRNVWTTENLKLPPQSLNFEEFKNRFPVLNGIKVEDYFNAAPRLLIGLPHIGLVRPFHVLNLDESFAVHHTNLGNIVFGSNEASSESTVCRIDVDVLDEINQQVAEFFSIENFGIKTTDTLTSCYDMRAEKMLQSTTKQIGCQYETGLLWRENDFEFIDSYTVALRRLQNLETKLNKDDELANWYNTKIEDYVLKSYARKLLPEEISSNDPRVWYLPHFVITNVNKDNKRRLVFDAAASIKNESFNSRLMKGPATYQPKPLMSMLLKFRQRRIGVCADIKEMFHRINIRKEDQVAQRFLWRNCDSARPPDVYVMQAMIFGSATSPCSAQYVKDFNARQYENNHPRAVKAICECHYVDDYVDSFDSAEEAIAVGTDVIKIHQRANFELRGFVSNDKDFCDAMNANGTQANELYSTNLQGGLTPSEKILGMFWMPSEDQFCFVLKFNRVPDSVLKGERKPTKREVLSLTMTIFDPFGFLAHVIITSKVLLQELWRHKLDWGQPIPDMVYDKWFKWYKELELVEHIRIPRCYSPVLFDPNTSVELHVFVDASEVAFAAVAYWRIENMGTIDIVFVAAKSRCAPIKLLSIPRLELQAAVLGTRLSTMITSTHDVVPKNITYWSDSKTVIKWIRSDPRMYKQFVAHRVSEILEISDDCQWRWVPGSQNPADEATRLKRPIRSRWFSGPEFLKLGSEHWPNLIEDVTEQDSSNEVRSSFLCTISDTSILQFERFSSYWKLVRVMSWVLRASKVFGKNKYSEINLPYLKAVELRQAELFLCKAAQMDSFAPEYRQLQHVGTVSKNSSIFKLTPYLDNSGLIRLYGRTSRASYVSEYTREPIILPKNHEVTKLLIKQYHEDFKHQNQESVCAAIRLKFWIPGLRHLIKSYKSKCQFCRNVAATPKPPLMGQHPIDRLSPFVRPFSYTGLDYMGPFLITIGRRSEKRWVALFTCLTVRAIHLEMAKDLSTDSVILCLRNFMNRRGLPVRIRSDCGTNFIGASKENFASDNIRIADECSRRGVEWMFNTPANPSAGGAWERMVRVVKRVLSVTLKEKAPQLDTFASFLIEAENIVNCRPLTHISVDASDDEPLTPNHFLLGCPNAIQTEAVPERVCLRKQWHILQQLKQTFWKRWVLEYLPELTRRTKWHQTVEPIEEGDVVVICDDNEACGQWKKGVVQKVFLADDGQVRSAVVKTPVGQLRRPACKLAVLDVRGETH